MVQALFTMTKTEPMNAQGQFCPNLECEARGQVGQGNIVSHGQKRVRYKCNVCKKTFSAKVGTMYAGLRSDSELVSMVVNLLSNGCPPQAIVKAFGLDERTVSAWQQRAGQHCEGVHKAVVMRGQLDAQHVQADEIRVKGSGWIAWLGLTMRVGSRLWLGGVVSASRNRGLAERMMAMVRRCIRSDCALLVMTDGWSAYPNAIVRAFRNKVPRQGERGRCHLQVWENLGIACLIKQSKRTGQHGFAITRRIVRGTAAFVAQQLHLSKGGLLINTAYIERFNATFRQRLACLTRRSRHAAKQLPTLHSAMFLLGTTYNFCTVHHSLRQPNFDQPHLPRWLPQTPAMASGLTDHVWTVHELLSFKLPPPPFIPPKRRGRPSKKTVSPSTT